MEFMSPENKHLRAASPEEALLEWLELPLYWHASLLFQN